LSSVREVSRVAYDGFSMVLPEGWADVEDEATYSEPEQTPSLTFAPANGSGALYVSAPIYDADLQPGGTPEDAEALVLEWGVRRGIAAPMALDTAVRREGGIASATYRLGGDFVQVWYLTNGRAVLHASYVCPWADREEDHAVREAIVGSLRFA
jgi:hypothetical protein